MEKILWAVPNVGQIFLLIRPAKGMSPRERLDNVLRVFTNIPSYRKRRNSVHILLQDPLFNRIRENKPHVLNKLVPISGDLMEDNLGLNQHDMQNICDEVYFNSSISIYSSWNLMDWPDSSCNRTVI